MDQLTESKCRDCGHCVIAGWWDLQRVCEISHYPVNADDGGCISFLPKKKARGTGKGSIK